jgi:hypothetical protein
MCYYRHTVSGLCKDSGASQHPASARFGLANALVTGVWYSLLVVLAVLVVAVLVIVLAVLVIAVLLLLAVLVIVLAVLVVVLAILVLLHNNQ